jgi:hypothetical protein
MPTALAASRYRRRAPRNDPASRYYKPEQFDVLAVCLWLLEEDRLDSSTAARTTYSDTKTSRTGSP